MTIAPKVDQYLDDQNIPYDTVHHAPSHSSVQSAIAAQVPLGHVAKAVVLKDDIDNYLMAVVPASSRVQIKHMREITDSSMKLASEQELQQQFKDCEKGAIPPVGQAYEMDMIWDSKLGEMPDLYLEAGDHETLIHLEQDAFQDLVGDSPHDDLCVSPHNWGDDM